MLTLAMDTSSRTLSVALLRGKEILCEFNQQVPFHQSESILPVIKHIFEHAGVTLESIDLFALTLGPGSFTGLRIGVSTIKGLALAMGKPVVGVSTLEALAFNVVPSGFLICPMLDARRNEVYTACFVATAMGRLEKVSDERVEDPREFLCRQSAEMLFLGDGAQAYEEMIKTCSGMPVHFAPPHLNWVRASVVGGIGIRRFDEGERLDLLTFSPRYLRLSQAEARALR